jgi:C1A family cysteine protease
MEYKSLSFAERSSRAKAAGLIALAVFGALVATYAVFSANPASTGFVQTNTNTTNCSFEKYSQWKKDHNKSFDQHEDAYRFKQWCKTDNYIHDHNSKNFSWKAAHNLFSHLSHEEFLATHTGAKHPHGHRFKNKNGTNYTKHNDTKHNDTKHNDTKHNDTKHNDTKHNDTKHNDTKHNDTKHNDTKHNDTKHNDTKHNDTKHNDTKHNDTKHNETNHNDTKDNNQTDHKNQTSSRILASIPTSVDWVTSGAVTGVKNQGECGSCWSFSATGNLEGLAYITTKKLPSLSEQELIDCSYQGAYGNEGCNGGNPGEAIQYVIDHKGIASETAYPYKGTLGKCNTKAPVAFSGVKSVNLLAGNDAATLLAAIANAPVSVMMDASSNFMSYSSGIYDDKSCGTSINHAVLAVGYNQKDGYLLVKNSWGTSWGQKGYFQIAYTESGPGICGIQQYPYVTAA